MQLYDPDDEAVDGVATASSASSSTAATIAAHERIAHQRANWFIPASLASQRTLNPIRAIVDKVRIVLSLRCVI